MANNPARGEYEIRLGGTVYTLRAGFDELVEFQEVFAGDPGGPPPIEVCLARAQNRRLKYVRAFLWAGLRAHHPEIKLTDVGPLVDQAGEAEITALFGRMAGSMSADPADLQALGIDPSRPTPAVPENPGRQTRKRKARASGGATSISSPDAPGSLTVSFGASTSVGSSEN